METLVRDYFDATADVYTDGDDTVADSWGRLDAQLLERVDLDGMTVLDIGCGDGSFLAYVTATADDSIGVGIDISGSMLPSNDDFDDIHFVRGSATAIPVRGRSFDLINLDDVLHHLVGPTRRRSKRRAIETVQEVTNLLEPGGYVYVKEQFYEGPVGSRTVTPRLVFYGLRFGGRAARMFDPGVHEELVVSFYTRAELRSIVASADLEIVEAWTRFHPRRTRLRSALVRRSGAYCLLARYDP